MCWKSSLLSLGLSVALTPAVAHAQTLPEDEFDLGGTWLDPSEDIEWYAPWSPATWTDAGAFRLDLSAGTDFTDNRQTTSAAALEQDQRTGRGRHYYAMATLQFPLEGLRLAKGRASPRAEELPHLEPSDESESEENGSSAFAPEQSDTASRTSEGDVPAVEQSAALLSQDDERKAHAGPGAEEGSLPFRPELLLLVTRELASHVAPESQGARARLSSLVRRSRLSGLSPELRLRGVLGFDRTTSTEESSGIYPGDTTTRGARDSLAEVRLTFRLDRLVLGDGEAALERQRIQLESERRKLVEETLELFSDWRLARELSRDASLPPDDRLKARVAGDDALARLHLLTNGWFEGEKTVRSLARELPDSEHPGDIPRRGEDTLAR